MVKRPAAGTEVPSPEGAAYLAPLAWVGGFYLIVAVWAVVCAAFLVVRIVYQGFADAFQLFMVAFVTGFTFYFSLGIAYWVGIDEHGSLRFRSIRGESRVPPQDVEALEGPPLAVGFVRFRLPREKLYLFCAPANPAFREVVAALRRANPGLRLKRL